MICSEEWREIEGCEGHYSVSDLGRVRSEDREVGHPMAKSGFVQRKGKIIKPHKDGQGYHRLQLYRKTYKVHRLVATAFCKGDTSLPVNHINGVKTDNTPRNLEFITTGENNRHAFRTGLTTRASGDAHPMVKIPSRRYREVFLWRDKGYSYAKIAKAYGVAKGTIWTICNKRRYSGSFSNLHYKTNIN